VAVVDQTKAVKDRAVAFNFAMTTLAVLTAAATFAISLIPPGNWLVGVRILAGCLAVATAVVGLFKFRNERAFKRQQEEERVSLVQALKAQHRHRRELQL
jgi:amino acid transporter